MEVAQWKRLRALHMVANIVRASLCFEGKREKERGERFKAMVMFGRAKALVIYWLAREFVLSRV